MCSYAIAPDASYAASGNWNATVEVWDVNNQRLLHTFGNHRGEVKAVAFSPDGKTLASGAWNVVGSRYLGSDINLWDVNSGALLWTRKFPNPDTAQRLVFSPDGRKLAMGTQEGNIILLDSATGKTLQKLLDKVTVSA